MATGGTSVENGSAQPRGVVGHRGAAGHAPENTIAGLRAAVALGVQWVEVDAKLTKDGAVILMHDDTLERTTNGQGRVADCTLAEIRTLDAGGWFEWRFGGERVPTLQEALVVLDVAGLRAIVEVKPSPGWEAETGRAVAALLDQQDGGHQLSSFAVESLLAASDTAPGVPRALLVEAVPDDWERQLRELDCIALHADQKQLDAAIVARVTKAGIPLLAYTVNDAARACELWSWGVDAVFSDFPDRLR
jgi:glycerophosphoryl diester phosphodiesterase